MTRSFTRALPHIFSYACGLAGMAGGLIAFAAMPVTAIAYMLPLGTVMGAVAGVALPHRNMSGKAIPKDISHKITDGFLGAFVGALGATFLPFGPLLVLGGSAGFAVAEGVNTLARHITHPRSAGGIAAESSGAKTRAPATTRKAKAASPLTSGLTRSFTTTDRVARKAPATAATRAAKPPKSAR